MTNDAHLIFEAYNKRKLVNEISSPESDKDNQINAKREEITANNLSDEDGIPGEVVDKVDNSSTEKREVQIGQEILDNVEQLQEALNAGPADKLDPNTLLDQISTLAQELIDLHKTSNE